jgi:starch phosphorylase
MSPLAMRVSVRRNGVSRRHGEVARSMWQPLFGESPAPIDHVTNGVHLPTFMCDAVWRLLAEHLGEPWLNDPADPHAWAGVWEIPNRELWEARTLARRRLVEYAQQKIERDRLLRGEELDYVQAGAKAFDPEALTLGFARRLAGYKRLALLVAEPERARAVLTGTPPVQLIVAGKAHPRDVEAKKLLQGILSMRRQINADGRRVAYLEDYDLATARELVAGCDVWLNLPRRREEASGTSGMKAGFNGSLHLSVLDGWWSEAFNGTNGWAIEDDHEPDSHDADARDADRLYTLLENEVIPMFYERDADGVPQRWCDRIKHALVSLGPTFTATRMLDEYVRLMYRSQLALPG